MMMALGAELRAQTDSVAPEKSPGPGPALSEAAVDTRDGVEDRGSGILS